MPCSCYAKTLQFAEFDLRVKKLSRTNNAEENGIFSKPFVNIVAGTQRILTPFYFTGTLESELPSELLTSKFAFSVSFTARLDDRKRFT